MLDTKKKIAIQEKLEAEERARDRGIHNDQDEPHVDSLLEEENENNDVIY